MNTHTYEIVDAALRLSNVTVDVWGPGWKGYDKSWPLSANIKRRQHRLHQLQQARAQHALTSDAELSESSATRAEWVEPEWPSFKDSQCGSIVFDVVWTIS
jgi:hypothetical protein